MKCQALANPKRLASLIRDLDGITLNEYEFAFTCVGPSVDDPSMKRLWIIPKDANAGANPHSWLKLNRIPVRNEFKDTLAHCTVVFPGVLPENVYHLRGRIVTLGTNVHSSTAIGHSDRTRILMRCISAATHLWVDRLRLHNSQGNIDHTQRENLLTRLSTRYWTDEKERVYVPPSLQPTKGGHDISATIGALLADKKPTCPERGLAVLYGPGGIGKTFILHRLANKLGNQAKSDIMATIPVFVEPPTLLHKTALENWLSHNGFDRLTLSQITTLLRNGCIVPLIDALDEVVKAEARQGSQAFLFHMMGLTSDEGAYGHAVLACRDYYLNSDSLVPDIVRPLRQTPVAELSFGFFKHQERRTFLQMRADLDPSHASKWVTALEEQAVEIIGKEADATEVEELIGHPVVLDTLARYIQDLPPKERVTRIDDFKIASSDVFGQIIGHLLERERDKLHPSWQASFKDRLKPEWLDPLNPRKQRHVLQELALLVAKDGAEDTKSKASDNEIYRTLIHGLFLFTKGTGPAADKRKALKRLLRNILGNPEVRESIVEHEHDSIIDAALDHLAEAYSSHILANTEPGLPSDLVFAFRHRMYFDYFLADALVSRIAETLKTKRPEELIQWCQTHHIFDTFGTCIDFLLWDPRVSFGGMEHIHGFIEKAKKGDDILASYLLSLALTLFLRRGQHLEGISVARLALAPYSTWELLLIPEILPASISSLKVSECSFPRLAIDGIEFRNLEIESCDFEALRLLSSTHYNCTLRNVECKELRFGGSFCLISSTMEVETPTVIVEDGANLAFHECQLSSNIAKTLNEYKSLGANIVLDRVTEIEAPLPSYTRQSSGRRFINKIMTLARRGGRKQFTIYEYKLRDVTPGSDEQFSMALDCLEKHGCVVKGIRWITLTDQAASHMYRPRRGEEPSYGCHKEFWEPIIAALDAILEV